MLEELKENLEYAVTLQRQLRAEDLSSIDFDSMRIWLEKNSTLLKQANLLINEYALLRDDYQQRMAGMIKAIAVASRDDGAIDSALDQIEYLGNCSSEELIKNYRRLLSIFRDTFSASFPQSGGKTFYRQTDR